MTITKRIVSKEVKQKGDENIKMVIKRLVPPVYKKIKTADEPAYEITKKRQQKLRSPNDGEPPAKKPMRKPRPKKPTEADVLSMDEIRRSALPPSAFRTRRKAA